MKITSIACSARTLGPQSVYPKVIQEFRPYLLILSQFLSAGLAMAQVCSIDLGPDATVCQGETHTFTAPAGFPTYLWSTGSSATSITVGTAGLYWGEVSYPTGELATNGDFSGGNTGFTTSFNYDNTLTTDGNYWIGTNAASYHPQFFGTGHGAFLMVNAGWQHAGWDVWCNTITVCPEQTYTLSVRAMSLASQGPPLLDWAIDGTQQGLWMQTGSQGSWTTFTNTWTSAPGQTSANFCVRVASGHGIGNDFGLDEVSISSTIVLRDEVELFVTPLPVVDLGPDATLCAGQNLVLDAAVPGGTYVWQDGSTASTFVVSGAGTYSVTVTADNCSASDAINVAYTPLPVVDLGLDQVLCAGENFLLNAQVPGGTYVWQNGSPAPFFNVTTGGTYSVSVTANNCTARDTVDFTFNPLPVVDLGADQVVCADVPVLLDATVAGATYVWQDGSSAATFSPTVSGPYSVTVTLNNCVASDATNITFTPLPVVDLGPDQTVCAGTAIVLDATVPGGTYLWQDGSTGATFSPTSSSTYSVTVTANGCSASDAVDITVNPLPVVDLGADQTVCADVPVLLDATVAGATYVWQDGSTAATFSPTVSGPYSVTVTLNNCVASDATNITFTPLPVVDLGPDQTVCAGTAVVLDATVPGGTYLWQDGSTGATFSPTSSSTYSVTVTANGCSASDAVDITVNPLPVVDLGADQTVCADVPVLLDATVTGATYLWQDGSTGATFSPTVTGPYSVTVTLNSCVASDATNITFTPLPVVDLGPDQTVCAGTALVLDATVPGGTYSWQDGSTGATFSPTSSSTYSVTVTANGCSASDAVDITVNPLPVVDLGADQTVCADVPVLLDATVAGATYVWQDGSTAATFSPTVTGPYSVTVTLNSCVASDATNITFTPLSVVDLGPDQTVCPGDVVLLDATVPGATYLWQDGSTASTFNADSPGPYSVQVTNNGCSSSDAFTLSHFGLQTVDLGADVVLCQGQSILFDVTLPGASFLWSTGAVSSTINVATAGTVWVRATQGTCSASDTVLVTVNPMPVVDLGVDQTLCAGEDAVLDATWTGATYLWSTGAVTPTITANATGNYSVDVSLTGCTSSDAVTVTVLSANAVNLGADVVACAGDAILLDATTPGSSYLWSDGSTSATLSPTASGTVWVRVSTGLCSASDTVLVTVNPMPVVDLGLDQTLCAGEDVVLDATWTGATYLWSTGAVTPTITANATGNYSVDVSLNACTASDIVTVTVLSTNAVNLGADVVACAGDAILLDATTPGSTYLWSDGSTSATFSPTVTGTVWIRVSTGLCSASDTVLVTVNPMPVVDLGLDQTLCAGEDVVLDATWTGATYLWSTGAVTPTITASATNNYSVDVSLNGCTASDEVTVTVLSANAVNLGADVVACAGDAILLDATTPGSTYLWSDGSTSATLSPTASATVWVRVSTGLCSASDTVLVTVNPMPVVDLGVDQTLCAGEDVVLDATWTGATYLWSTGAVTPTITANATGNYSVDVSLNGCTASDAVTVTVLSANAVNLGADVVACADEPILLDATTPGSSYLWSNGSTAATLSPTASGTFWVRVSTGLCSASDTVLVTVNPAPQIELGPAVTLCGGESSVSLDVTYPGATYLWNTGDAGASLDVTTSGTYSVEVVLNGCVTADTVVVTFGSLAIDLGVDTTLCPGETLVLTTGAFVGTAVWNDVQTSPTYTVDAAGTYWIEIGGSAGCNARDSITVSYVQMGELDLGPDMDLCEGEDLVLDATLPGATILWENGSSTAIRTVSSTGLYSVEATVGVCMVADEVLVTFNPMPIVDLGADQAICPSATAVFDATTPGATYLWQDGSTDPTFLSTSAGPVSVSVSVNGCTTEDEAAVTMLTGPQPQLGNDTLLCEGNALLLSVAEADATYLWDDGSTGSDRNVSEADAYWVQVTNNGCAGSDTIVVDVFTQDSWDLGTDVTICSGASTVLDATFNGAQYAWSNGASTPSIQVGTTGNYSVEITVAGCTAEDEIHVEVVQTPAPDLGPDISICEQDSVELSTATVGGTLIWSTGETASSIMVHDAGTYTVVRDSLGCTASDAITVFILPTITEIDLGPDRSLCPGAFDAIQAEWIAGATYLWNTGATGDLLAIQNPGEYTVTATGTCINATGTVVVRADDCGTYVYVPNTFTPNDDGINEVFLPSLAGPVDIYQFDIFDRWGERIMTTTDRNVGWDGTYSGTPAQDGVYVWKVYYRIAGVEGVRVEQLTGHVSLLR